MHIFFIGKRKSPGQKNDYRSKHFCMTRIILLSLSENWVQKILCHILAFWLHAFLSGATQDDFFSVRRIFLRRTKLRSPSRKGGISFAREMDFFCSKLCDLLSSLLLCASVNITASLRFLQTFHLKLFSSKEKFFSREKLFSNEKFFFLLVMEKTTWQWRPQPSSAAWPRAEESLQNLEERKNQDFEE